MVREAHIQQQQETLSVTARLQRLIGSIILLIRGEMDNSAYEEESRHLVGSGGYVLYTVDKVMGSFLKHIHTLLSDAVCSDLIVEMIGSVHIGCLLLISGIQE